LQCVAVCCSVLHCGALCCSVLQCVAVCCIVLQCVAVRCSALQCVALYCSVLQCVAVCYSVTHMHHTCTQNLIIISVRSLHHPPLSPSLVLSLSVFLCHFLSLYFHLSRPLTFCPCLTYRSRKIYSRGPRRRHLRHSITLQTATTLQQHCNSAKRSRQ